MRTIRFALLASAGLVFAAGCSGDVTAPAGPTIAGSPSPLRAPLMSTSATGGTTEQDSVVGGYGSGSTGGIEYESFEYDPETGTEYVATPDTTPTKP